MLFNSFEFLIFLPIVFLLYWKAFGNSIKLQNLFIVVVSCIFYGWWDWRFLFLIAFTTGCSYYCGRAIRHLQVQNREKAAKAVSVGNVLVNIGILAVFKYYNFFVDSMQALLNAMGGRMDYPTLNIILPVGISFYTFQALSYTIDVHRKKIEPTTDILAFFSFVSFFPQLVAGPIERATNLLPQFLKPRTFSYKQATDGCRQILWGFCKKVIIADQCAVFVDNIWSSYSCRNGITLFLAAVLFAFQIYGDFSGYSDIAIGTSKLFGIRLKSNFVYPYFSRDIAEFWKRWHISLNTWFVDYVYIPLGGNRHGKLAQYRNTFVIFLLSGLWHGANWTFVLWGVFHALLFMPLILMGQHHRYNGIVAEGKWLPSVKELLQMVCTFMLFTIGLIIFRAENISQAFDYIVHMLDFSNFWGKVYSKNIHSIFLCFVMLIVEWMQRDKEHPFELPTKGIWGNYYVRYVFYVGVVTAIILFANQPTNFIYFQF